MSILRQNLDRAKSDYQSARFPGDLGLLVDQAAGTAAKAPAKGTAPLRVSRGMSPWVRTGINFAAAACVLVAIGVFWSLVGDRGGSPDKVATTTTPTRTTDNGNNNVPVVANADETTESFSIVPPAEYASFSVTPEDMSVASMPSMPSFDDFVSEETTATTQVNN